MPDLRPGDARFAAPAPLNLSGEEVILQDGTRVGIRGTSSSGSPTIDINTGSEVIKIHVK